MADIEINRAHGMTLERARDALDAALIELGKEHGLTYSWDGNEVSFKVKGAQGSGTVDGTHIHIEIHLEWWAKPFKPRIEAAVIKSLDKGIQEGNQEEID
ncbi:MAG: polyhydroxyalkanoic acid system family protein [Aeromicrobium sp.]